MGIVQHDKDDDTNGAIEVIATFVYRDQGRGLLNQWPCSRSEAYVARHRGSDFMVAR
jgi:hypothetical protein